MSESPSRPEPACRRATRGKGAEDLAAEWLAGRGWRILDRNWRCGHKELDIVALDGRTVVFVEVKFRSPGPQSSLEAVSPRQRRNLRIAAESWIHSHPDLGDEFRFDLVAVRKRRGHRPRLRLVSEAFHGEF